MPARHAVVGVAVVVALTLSWVLPQWFNHVEVVNDGASLRFSKMYGAEKVTFSVFYLGRYNGERQMVREHGYDSTAIWENAGGRVSEVYAHDESNGVYTDAMGTTDPKDIRDAQNLWNTYYNDMQLDKLIPYYLQHKPSIPMLQSPF